MTQRWGHYGTVKTIVQKMVDSRAGFLKFIRNACTVADVTKIIIQI